MAGLGLSFKYSGLDLDRKIWPWPLYNIATMIWQSAVIYSDYVTGEFACNNSSLYRKQICWKDLKSEAVRTKI